MLSLLVRTVRGAGERIMPFFRHSHGARSKADHSPVTDADVAAHEFIRAELARHFPDIPIISEEDNAHGAAPSGYYFLVDPLDGTKAFIRGEEDFSVNIGLVEGDSPRLGVLGVPVSGVVYGGAFGLGAFREEKDGARKPIHVRPFPAAGLTVTRSRSHPSAATEAFLKTLSIERLIPASGAAKLAWVAEGAADCYPRFGRTMEWDTAAGHAILLAAGGRVETLEGEMLRYGKPGFENPGFIAWGAAERSA